MSNKKMKKFWFGTIFRRDYLIAKDESKEQLIEKDMLNSDR